MAVVTAEGSAPASEQKGLKANAIGFVDALVIGLASTAPAYSLAAIIGSLVVVIGVQAPAALLASFVPMFFIATAFYYMNRADPDCGTTFSWVTRALGPWAGWMGGWAVCVTGILVVGSLADVGARYTYVLFGWDGAAGSKVAVTVLAIAYIVVLTAVCIMGTELSARVQNVMILAQVGALLLFAVVALVKVYGGDALDSSIEPASSWYRPSPPRAEALSSRPPPRRLHLLGLGERRQPDGGDEEFTLHLGPGRRLQHPDSARHLRLGVRRRRGLRRPGAPGRVRRRRRDLRRRSQATSSARRGTSSSSSRS